MKLTFYGAAGEVTGSKHLIDTGSAKILLDCGMFQGHEHLVGMRNTLAFDPASLDAVIISHAHLDHVGLLPLLVKQGFRGPIFSTSATRDLAELILLDAAHLQQQDATYANRKRWPGSEQVVPLYTPDDVPAVMQQWQVWPYVHTDPNWRPVVSGVEAKLYDAGHILGSAVIVVQARAERLAYTGDLGRGSTPLLRDPAMIVESVPTLIMESTYGNREHHPVDSVQGTIVDLVKRIVARRGKIIVPAFSLGRTQELVYLLHQLTDRQQLPRLPIYVDSPLASRITTVFTQHQQEYDSATATDFRLPGENPFAFRNLQYTQSVEESKALNNRPGPMMIISASGMATGGRIMHHLANSLADPRNCILFTGYQAEGSIGRNLVSGARALHLFGRKIPVRAEIETINDLSAHADVHELETYAASIPGLRRLFLVHGEPDRAAALQQQLLHDHPQWHVIVPTLGQSFDLPG